jgi:hypothetical protein
LARVRFATAHVAIVLVLASASGCARDPEYDGCYVEHPAFLLHISAQGGPLPEGTHLRVKYGAGVEDYILRNPAESPDVIFCTAVNPDAELAEAGEPSEAGLDAADEVGAGHSTSGDAQAPIEALLCELWTQGAATVTVDADGYPRLVKALTAKRDGCGIETVERELVLQAPDGGN